MGRPTLDPTDRRSEVFRLRFTPRELALLKSLAKQSGKAAAAYAREKVLR